MGEVYKALDTRLHRPVALKVLRSDKDPNDATTAGGVQRLLREARAAAAFNHPNSVAIYELGEAEGIPYIAMEYVVGSSLRAFVGDRNVALDVIRSAGFPGRSTSNRERRTAGKSRRSATAPSAGRTNSKSSSRTSMTPNSSTRPTTSSSGP